MDFYDVGIFYISDLYYKIKECAPFLEDLNDDATFKIPNTEIYLNVTCRGCIWYDFGLEVNHGGERISFEEALDRSPEDIQKKFLFNLNLFEYSGYSYEKQ